MNTLWLLQRLDGPDQSAQRTVWLVARTRRAARDISILQVCFAPALATLLYEYTSIRVDCYVAQPLQQWRSRSPLELSEQ